MTGFQKVNSVDRSNSIRIATVQFLLERMSRERSVYDNRRFNKRGAISSKTRDPRSKDILHSLRRCLNDDEQAIEDFAKLMAVCESEIARRFKIHIDGG